MCVFIGVICVCVCVCACACVCVCVRVCVFYIYVRVYVCTYILTTCYQAPHKQTNTHTPPPFTPPSPPQNKNQQTTRLDDGALLSQEIEVGESVSLPVLHTYATRLLHALTAPASLEGLKGEIRALGAQRGELCRRLQEVDARVLASRGLLRYLRARAQGGGGGGGKGRGEGREWAETYAAALSAAAAERRGGRAAGREEGPQ